MDILHEVREAARRTILFLPHAVRQMSRPDRMISIGEVERVISGGEIIEDYPTDPRGASCLILGSGDGGRPIHVVCAPKPDYLAVISAYLPDATLWTDDFKRRRSS